MKMITFQYILCAHYHSLQENVEAFHTQHVTVAKLSPVYKKHMQMYQNVAGYGAPIDGKLDLRVGCVSSVSGVSGNVSTKQITK